MMGRIRDARRRGRCLLVSSLVAFVAMWTTDVGADEATPSWLRTKGGHLLVLATLLGGTGVRFNNPYRLATPLGDNARSVSRSAGYVDVGGGLALGNPGGWQHGLSLRLTRSVEGVPQSVITPSYLLVRRVQSWAFTGRAGLPLVLTPDTTTGLELGAGVAYFIRAGLGVTAEVVGDLFYGAGTDQVAKPTYPMVSGQAGIVVAYEVLP